MSPYVSGVICPNQKCKTFVTLRLDCDDPARYDPVVKRWQLVCPNCHSLIVVSEEQLSLKEVTASWLERRKEQRTS
jgi:hypothetical protein